MLVQETAILLRAYCVQSIKWCTHNYGRLMVVLKLADKYQRLMIIRILKCLSFVMICFMWVKGKHVENNHVILFFGLILNFSPISVRYHNTMQWSTVLCMHYLCFSLNFRRCNFILRLEKVQTLFIHFFPSQNLAILTGVYRCIGFFFIYYFFYTRCTDLMVCLSIRLDTNLSMLNSSGFGQLQTRAGKLPLIFKVWLFSRLRCWQQWVVYWNITVCCIHQISLQYTHANSTNMSDFTLLCWSLN